MESVWEAVWPEWKAEKKLGEGSCGTVLEASCADVKRSAVKIIRLPRSEAETEALRAEGLDDEDLQRYYAERAEELMTEVRFARELKDHPNIVRVEDCARLKDPEGIGETILIRMELLTPLPVYAQEHVLSTEDVRQMGSDLCQALAACHEKHLIHRDIKPENIFVDAEGHFKLGDFGIARRLDAATTYLTQVGTPLYTAPEVALGQDYDSRADIYSLGLVL